MNTDTMRALRQRLIDLQSEEDGIKVRKAALQRELQEYCIHGREVEADLEVVSESVELIVEPVMRLCLICGIEEIEEGEGFKVLKSRQPKRVSRDEFFLLRGRLSALP